MSEIKPESSGGTASYSDPRAAYSSKVEEFRQAISMLYIKNNASGRNKFRLKWPDVAAYVFGEQLIHYDDSGVTDRSHRARLEEEALARRYELQQLLAEFEDKSVKAGALEFGYVGEIIDKLGTSVVKYMYAENIIERVRPGLIAKEQSLRETREAEKKDADDAKELERAAILTAHHDEERRILAQEKEALRNKLEAPNIAESADSVFQVNIDDDIRPIDVSKEHETVNIVPADPAEKPVSDELVQSVPELPTIPAVLEAPQQIPTEVAPEAVIEESPTPAEPTQEAAAPKIHIPGLRLKQDAEKPPEQNPENQAVQEPVIDAEPKPKKPEKGMLQALFSACAGKRVSSHEVSSQQG